MSLDSKIRIFLGASTGMFLGLSAAQPVSKTGPCPTLTRYNAPAGENWAQFNAEPNPPSTYPVNTIQNPLAPEQHGRREAHQAATDHENGCVCRCIDHNVARDGISVRSTCVLATL